MLLLPSKYLVDSIMSQLLLETSMVILKTSLLDHSCLESLHLRHLLHLRCLLLPKMVRDMTHVLFINLVSFISINILMPYLFCFTDLALFVIIVAAVVGGLILAVFIIGLIICISVRCYKRHHKRGTESFFVYQVSTVVHNNCFTLCQF